MTKPTVVSLFTGAGGLDYGFEAAGFATAVAVDLDHDSCQTIRKNRKWAVIERDIFHVPSKELLQVAGLKRGNVDALIGGPPCQPFSKSAYWFRGDTQRLRDPRAGTLGAFLRVLEDTAPRTFVLENVEGLAYKGKTEGRDLLLEAIQDINERTGTNYQPSLFVVNAADYGVPQLRRRTLLVGARDGTTLSVPPPTHAAQTDLFGHRKTHHTAWDALADSEPAEPDLEVRGKWAELLPSIPEGTNYLWHTERGGGLPLFGWRRKYWTFLLKLAKNRPSWTIQAQPGPAVGPFHWKNRRLSIDELCRLQTFPHDVRIIGTRTSAQRQVGNAVPSLLAEVLGNAIRTQLLHMPHHRRPLKLMPLDRSPAPPPEPVVPVTGPYRSLAGRHRAHPGTGKGRYARAREA
jgi:DNA (cytosine-5)-methyltransferase 1